MSSLRMARVQDPIIPHITTLIRNTPGTISLGQGVVHYPPPPAAKERLAHFWSNPTHHLYSPVDGIPELKLALEAKLKSDNDINVSAGNCLFVTAGANMAFLNALFAITEPGDEIILPAPFYFNHDMAITMLGCNTVTVAVDEHHQIDLTRLENAVTSRTRAIVTNSPHNPTGAVYSKDTLMAINALCAARGIYHISDEAYEYFTYDDVIHFSPGSLPGAANHTVSLFSLSKSYGFAGWRIGYMTAPARLAQAISKAQDTNLINATVASQHAAIGALAAGAGYPRSHLRELEDVKTHVADRLNQIADLCTAPMPSGAFYFFLKINTQIAALPLVEQLISTYKVAAIPGTAFGMTEGCYLRIAFGALQKKTATEGIGRFIEGIRKIV